MKLSVSAFSLTAGILWGLVMLLVGLANLAWPEYGGAFLKILASVYPGYDGEPVIRSVWVGGLYAFVDGLIGGLVFACLYNMLAACGCCKKTCEPKSSDAS